MSIHSYIQTNISSDILLGIAIHIRLSIRMNIWASIRMNIRMNIVMKIHSKKIIELIKKERIVTSSEVAEFFGVSWNTAEKYLMDLALDGKIERIKKAGVTLWLLR